MLFCCFGLFWRQFGVVLHRISEIDINNACFTLSEEMASKSEGETESNSQQHQLPNCFAHVDGAVVSPECMSFSVCGVCDALDAAGGLAEDADTSQINLAEHCPWRESICSSRREEC